MSASEKKKVLSEHESLGYSDVRGLDIGDLHWKSYYNPLQSYYKSIIYLNVKSE